MNARRRAKSPTPRKRARLQRADLLRERRRWGAGRTIYDFRANLARPGAQLQLAGLRVKLLLRQFSMGDGIAYIPYDALGEAAPAPRSGSVPDTAQIGPQGSGKTPAGYLTALKAVVDTTTDTGLPPAPLNAAYGLGDEFWGLRAWDTHDHSGDCPTCGPCEKCDDECQSCHCCKCKRNRIQKWAQGEN